MKLQLDTNVLIAALVEEHFQHPRARPWLEQALLDENTLIIGVHGLAELYCVLTRPPFRCAPSEARLIIRENIEQYAQIVVLDADDYSAVLDEQAKLGTRSGAVYDALHARVAQKAAVDRFLTFDRDFQRVWPDAGERVATP